MMTGAAFAAGWRETHQATAPGDELRSAYGLATFSTGNTLTLQSPPTHPPALTRDGPMNRVRSTVFTSSDGVCLRCKIASTNRR